VPSDAGDAKVLGKADDPSGDGCVALKSVIDIRNVMVPRHNPEAIPSFLHPTRDRREKKIVRRVGVALDDVRPIADIAGVKPSDSPRFVQ